MKIEEFNKYMLSILILVWAIVGVETAMFKGAELELIKKKSYNIDLDTKIKNLDIKINTKLLKKVED